MYLKQKKKNQKKNKKRKDAKIFLNILRMNQRTLSMICLKIILIFHYLVPWQKKLYTTKNKNKNNELVELSKVRWSNLKDEIKEMSKEEIENKKRIKY